MLRLGCSLFTVPAILLTPAAATLTARHLPRWLLLFMVFVTLGYYLLPLQHALRLHHADSVDVGRGRIGQAVLWNCLPIVVVNDWSPGAAAGRLRLIAPGHHGDAAVCIRFNLPVMTPPFSATAKASP